MNPSNLIRQICRACRCVHTVAVGHDTGGKDFRCDSCDAANYERRHFERTMQVPAPETVAPTDEVEATDGPLDQTDEVSDVQEVAAGDTALNPGPQGGGTPEESGAPEASSGDYK